MRQLLEQLFKRLNTEKHAVTLGFLAVRCSTMTRPQRFYWKVAVTVRFVAIWPIEHCRPDWLSHPAQPTNVLPGLGAAESVTSEPSVTENVHWPVQTGKF